MGRVRTTKIKSAIKSFARKPSSTISENPYARIDLIDGTHPWQEVVPEGTLMYDVRKLNQGKVIYFNFDLAKEMGLIPKDHKHKLNAKLKKTLIDAFSLRIVNEYDQEKNVRYHPAVMKPNKYMATRYLQLQHPDKAGRTSGDGRSIWNGCVEFNGTMWDVSSRGTGVTALAPGAVQAGKPLRSGNLDGGYGCGMAEVDELIGSAIMAEIFHRRGINTERMLCIIDLDGSNGIGVRAGKNLLRPAHLFAPLKQGNLESLKKATNYLIERQHRNKTWNFDTTHPKRYDYMLREISKSFAKFVGFLDRNYIFAWMDWDGDNILADAGIIDYGSIRQFGLRHDQYRYDDVERMSTNLNEQKNKARQMLQTFAQAMDYIKNGVKKQLHEFANDSTLKNFDQLVDQNILEYFLYQAGLTEEQRALAVKKHPKIVSELFEKYYALEATKTSGKTRKVADGINKPAIFNLRKGLVFLSNNFDREYKTLPSAKDFFKKILSKEAPMRDRKMTPHTKRKIQSFLKTYYQLTFCVFGKKPAAQTIKAWNKRTKLINTPNRMTGDGAIMVVDEIMLRRKRKKASPDLVQKAIDGVIESQTDSTPWDGASPNIDELTTKLVDLIDDQSESI